MKKIVLILFIFLSNEKVNGQVFKSGLIGGISGAQVEGDGYAGYRKLGLIIGGYVSTNLSKNWSTQFEIYYINKGSRKNPRPDKGDITSFKLNLNYIEIPVLLAYHYKKFQFEAGLYYGILLNTHIEDQNGIRSLQGFPFKKGDFGGFIGASYQLNGQFSFNLRSKSSILPIRDFQNLDINIGIFDKLFNRGWYNLDLNFTLRYHFGKVTNDK